MASSRLAVDVRGRQVVVATTPAPELEPGHVWLVVGNDARRDSFGWLGENSSREPSELERAMPALTARQRAHADG